MRTILAEEVGMATIIGQLITFKNISIQATPVGWISAEGVSLIFSYFDTIFNVDNYDTCFAFLMMVIMYDVIISVMEGHERGLVSASETLLLLLIARCLHTLRILVE